MHSSWLKHSIKRVSQFSHYSESHASDRAQAASRLRNREVNILFTVDLLNEGWTSPK